MRLPQVFNARTEQNIAATFDEFEIRNASQLGKILPPPAADVMRRPLVRIQRLEAEKSFLRWHGNGDKPAGFQQRRRLFHNANRIRQVFQDLKQRDQIK